MKTYYIGLVIIALLFFNCDSDSSGSNDNFLNGGNYISENNFYTFYISSEIDLLQEEIDYVQDLIDSGMGGPDEQEELDALNAEQDYYEDELQAAFLNGTPVPLETPPSECPDARICFPVDASYLVMHNRFYNLDISIYNADNELIFGSIEQETTDLPGVNDYKYIDIAIDQYTGPVTIIVQKYDSSDDLIDYLIPGYAY